MKIEDKRFILRKVYFFIFVFSFFSCSEKSKISTKIKQVESQDTIIVRQIYDVSKFNYSLSSKSISYYSISGKDTLDISIGVNESKTSGEVNIDFRNNKSIMFKDLLKKFDRFLPFVKEDFDLTRIESLVFDPPIFYQDICIQLSRDYKLKYGRKNIDVLTQKEFLMETKLKSSIDSVFLPYKKKVNWISIEKFHLFEKEHYDEYLNIDFSAYPDFAIDGIMLNVQLTENQ
ncbi:hypothetical protein [Aquiflexum gelatinilyticum]|uniref:Uncharacterized protein n=1 Tax=Aquiflexum gelatinilyticum TaxID=2961943 RepID=A0A9X2T1Q2_9BACT|nr:hypothetical protein [Aquiflexum gelatinilyticum]MCR9016998.1 hypothetical protein [Aquiflexum gelatinilyticum]